MFWAAVEPPTVVTATSYPLLEPTYAGQPVETVHKDCGASGPYPVTPVGSPEPGSSISSTTSESPVCPLSENNRLVIALVLGDMNTVMFVVGICVVDPGAIGGPPVQLIKISPTSSV